MFVDLKASDEHRPILRQKSASFMTMEDVLSE